MSLTPGVRLGPYEVLSLLGAGGMGQVYKARDTRLDRTVAIKVLPAHVGSSPDLRERFEREARAVAALNHPHICTLHDVGQQDGIDFLVMEYLEGQTLAERLHKLKGPLPLDQALQYAIQLADALDKAHRQGIVHRDLKPGNVMLVKSGAKLLDFGLAKLRQEAAPTVPLSQLPTAEKGLTAHGTILGTLHYMAPEQIEGQEADARTDIFAFGVVLYEMLTGKNAFTGKTQASLFGAILKDEPPPISTIQPLTPPVLDHVVKRCLAKEPDERWQAASDVMRELKWVAEAPGVATGAARGRSSFRKARLAWAIAALLLVIAGTLSVPAVLYVRRAELEPVVTRLEMNTPPTSERLSFALSPNGRQVAFVANNGEHGSQLWLRSLDQLTAQPLAGTEGAQYPFWAPDSRAIGFFADGKLKRVDVAGGAPQVLATAGIRGGAWNRDGVIVFSMTSSGLMRVAATGGTPVPVTRRVPGQSNHHWPHFLPDGHRFLFFVLGSPDTRGVYMGSLDGGEPTRVLAAETAAAYVPPGYLFTVSQGVLVAQPFDASSGVVTGEPIPLAQAVATDSAFNLGAFSVSEAGVLAHRSGAAAARQLVWFDRAGKELGALGPAENTALSVPTLSRDGRQVAVYRVVQGNGDVWLIEVARGIASRFTFDPATDASAVWSPDGSRLIFRSSRNGISDLFEKSANGAADEQPLLMTAQNKSVMDWSPDGNFLLYTSDDAKTQSDLWALPLSGERKPFPVVQTSFDEVQGQFSPDGRWVVYVSNETGRYEVYVRPFPGPGGKWQVSTAGGIYPRWRGDGQELFYVTLDNRLMAAPIRVSPDARTLAPGAPVALFATRLAIAANVGIGGYISRAQYAVASDRRFLMLVAHEDTSPITIVQNWPAGLKK